MKTLNFKTIVGVCPHRWNTSRTARKYDGSDHSELIAKWFAQAYETAATLMLTEAVINKARRIGKGNLSAGVRKAVTEYPQDATTGRTSDDQA